MSEILMSIVIKNRELVTSFVDKLYRDHGNDYRPVIDCFTHAEWIIIRRWSVPHCHIYIPTAKAVQLIGAIKIQSRMARQNE